MTPEAEALYMRVLNGEQPDTEDDTALEELKNLGLIRFDSDGVALPVDPAFIEARATAGLYARAGRALEAAAGITERFHGLRAAWLQHPPAAGGGIEYLRGSARINARLAPLLAGASSEVIFCQPGGPRSERARSGSIGRDAAALERGVRLRTLYHESARSGAGMDAWVRELTQLGAEVRTLNEPFSRMFVIDRRIAVIPGDEIMSNSEETIAQIVHDPGLAGHLAQQFERDWNRAETWGQAEVPGGLSERARLVMAGLSAGDTIPVIAERIGISRQSVDRELAALKEHFGKSTMSLFELGCRWTEERAKLGAS